MKESSGLSLLPNISTVIEKKLLEAGVESREDLIKTGAVEVFKKIRRKDPEACLSMLYALEGAIEGVRWHNLDKNTKEELKKIYRKLF